MARPAGGRRPDGGVQWFRALVLIVVLVAIGAVVLAKTSNTTSTKTAGTTAKGRTTTTASTAPAPTTTTTVLPASQVKVQVLNGVLTGSLAKQWATKLKSQYGYVTTPPDDATAKVASSVIYIVTPGYEAEAAQLAARVGLSASAVNPAPLPSTAPVPTSERSVANLVLVVGPDLAGTA